MVNEETEDILNEEAINYMNEADIENRSDRSQNEDHKEERILLNIYDPSNWDNIDQNFRDLLVERGPIRKDDDGNFPKDNFGRHFSSSHYIRHLSNGEKRDRKWLVYSDIVDRVFCFCCKLFKEEGNKTQLATEGFKDWRNIGQRLKSHETSNEHIICMSNWIELEMRFRKNQTIDKSVQEQINKDREH